MGRRSYKGDKRRKELARQKKQAEKREKRFNKRSGDDTEGNESIDSTEQPVEDSGGLADSS